MLKKIIISNYAIIDKLEIVPDKHFNTVTGETGAGKSIILGALSLILGDRADTAVLINKDEKCIVEGHFDVKGNTGFAGAMQHEDLDNEDTCIIRREISTSGKSRAFVNDTPVTLNVLSKLTGMLVDLHQQFGHLALQDDTFQFDVIDAVAQNAALRKEYTALYTTYTKRNAELTALKTEQTQWQKESDYKQFLLNELTEAGLKEDEIEQAEQQLKQLSHAEKIINVLQSSRMMLEEGEQPMVNELKRITQQLQTIADVMPETAVLNERLASALAELKDIASELDSLESKVNMDEKLMAQLQERMDTGYKLFKKHAIQTTAEILQLQARLEDELKASFDLNDKITALEAAQQQAYIQVLETAGKVSAKRIKSIPAFVKKVNELLALVGMPNAEIKITIAKAEKPGVFGADEIVFLLDANKSGQFLPVYKAASGGEMSRIMLCIKSLTAQAMHMPTLIFDEVDTGISGEAARQVGMLLRDLAQYHQVICITHQPQVAAKGNTHFYVYKEATDGGRIQTRLRTLKEDERIQAIARMIGGEQPSNAAIANAKELVAN